MIFSDFRPVFLLDGAGKIQFRRYGKVAVDQRTGHTVQRTRQLCRFQRFKHQPFRVAGNIALGGFSWIDVIFDGDKANRLQETQTASGWWDRWKA